MELLNGEERGGGAREGAVNGCHGCCYTQHQHHREHWEVRAWEIWGRGGGGKIECIALFVIQYCTHYEYKLTMGNNEPKYVMNTITQGRM